jgi:uncharacterized protein (DUF1330 family)
MPVRDLAQRLVSGQMRLLNKIDDLGFISGQSALATVADFGGELLAGTPMPKVLEGTWDGNWAAVLRFPSLAAAEKWYNSAEYRPLKDLRINELTEMNRVLLLEGVAPVTGHQQ